MTSPRTALEQVARAYCLKHICQDNPILWERYGHCKEEVDDLVTLLAAQRAAVLEEVIELVERRALICKTNSESHLQDGVYTQARSWEGGWHECERIIGELREEAQEQRP